MALSSSPRWRPLSPRRTLAVARAEVQRLSRQRAPFVLRVLVALPFVLALWTFAGVQAPTSALAVIERVAGAQALLAGFALLFFLGALASGTLLGVASSVEERREDMLSVLLLSHLTPLEILLGKLCALIGACLMLLAAGAPLVAIVLVEARASAGWLVDVFLVLLLFNLIGLSIGLWAGLRWSRPAPALIGAIAALLVVFALPGILLSLGLVDDPHVEEALLNLSPLALFAIVEPGGFTGGTRAIARGSTHVSFAVALVALLFALRSLPRTNVRVGGSRVRGAQRGLDGLYERLNPGALRIASAPAGILPRGNPLAWRMLRALGIRAPAHALRFALIAIVLSGAWLSIRAENVAVQLMTLGWGASLAMSLVATWMGALSFAGERGERTFDLLRTTTLDDRRLFFGRLLGTARVVLLLFAPPLTLAVAVAHWVEATGGLDQGALLFPGSLAALLSALSCALIAQLLSLHFQSALRALLGVLTFALFATVLAAFAGSIGPYRGLLVTAGASMLVALFAGARLRRAGLATASFLLAAILLSTAAHRAFGRALGEGFLDHFFTPRSPLGALFAIVLPENWIRDADAALILYASLLLPVGLLALFAGPYLLSRTHEEPS